MILSIVLGSLLPDKLPVFVGCDNKALEAKASKLNAERPTFPGRAREKNKTKLQMQAHVLNHWATGKKESPYK